MLTKDALKFAATFTRASRGKTTKQLYRDFTLEQIALISLSSALLKQKLIIKQYEKRDQEHQKLKDFLKKL